MTFHNRPEMKDADGKEQMKKYTHQPLTFEHYGIHVKIQTNGKVIISTAGRPISGEEVEYDEVEIPASLIFKIATSLSLTRKVEYIPRSKPPSTEE